MLCLLAFGSCQSQRLYSIEAGLEQVKLNMEAVGQEVEALEDEAGGGKFEALGNAVDATVAAVGTLKTEVGVAADTAKATEDALKDIPVPLTGSTGGDLAGLGVGLYMLINKMRNNNRKNGTAPEDTRAVKATALAATAALQGNNPPPQPTG